MAADVAIRCDCGTVRGVLRDASAATGSHVVCYCGDCQAFAHALRRAGDILDAHGGTEIFQTSPARVNFTAGASRVACLRLSGKGLMRWYASCCNTPLANTLATDKLPFVGLVHSCLERPPNGGSLEPILGPVLVRGFRSSAKGDPAAIPPDAVAMPLLMLRFAARMLRWKLRGDARRSPFFDTAGRPIAAPRVLAEEERAELRQAVGQAQR